MSEILLTQVNVWLDAIFLTLWLVVIVALIAHFLISIPTGRFRKTFILKQWPEHDWAPPGLPKFMHFQHLVMMLLLCFSGMYIRFPFLGGDRTAMRYVHYVAMVIVGVNYLWRLWYAFFSRARDYREFAITKKDVQSLVGVAMFYAYVSNKKPHVAKYNVMQKGTYDLFAILMLLQGLTGLSLITTPFIFGVSPREILLFWAPGSIAAAGAWARIIHYSINWLFVILATVHFYLAAFIDLPCTLDFFGIKKMKVVESAHGHDESHVVATAAEAD